MDTAKAFLGGMFAEQAQDVIVESASANADVIVALVLIGGAMAAGCLIWILCKTTSWIAERIGLVIFVWGSMAAFIVCHRILVYGIPIYNYATLIGNLTVAFNGLRGVG
jgi:hypothetical protein